MQAEIVNAGPKAFTDLEEGDWFIYEGAVVRFVAWEDWNRYTDCFTAEIRRNGIPDHIRVNKTKSMTIVRVLLG